MKSLTDKQKFILDFIEDFMDETAMAPTVYEIADHFKIKSSTVFAHLRALQRKNCLTRSSKARSISLNKSRKRQRKLSALSVPVIDGAKRCELFCDSAMLGNDNAGLFAIKVNGNSFKDEGIFEGDIVVVKPAGELKAGDLIVSANALGQTEFRRHTLAPAAGAPNASGASIKGVVVALQRKYAAETSLQQKIS